MLWITLKSGKKIQCSEEKTILDSCLDAGIVIEHSCRTGRCNICKIKLSSGKTINNAEEQGLTKEEKEQGYLLSCINKPLSDVTLDFEELRGFRIFRKKIVPAKISAIIKLSENLIQLVLRLPPNSNFKYISGQYVNLIKGSISRSYSIANYCDSKNELEFFIKKYENGMMSSYLFSEAQINNLLRIEGPIGTFFYRESDLKNIIFVATGTGVAPIKSMLEDIDRSKKLHGNKKFWIVIGNRFPEDIIWEPNFKNLDITYIPVLSRPNKKWNGARGYVQDIVLQLGINLKNAQTYACGSEGMISSLKEILVKNGLGEDHFFSDKFVKSS